MESLLRDAQDRTRISSISLAEAVDVLVRVMGRRVGAARVRIEWLQAAGLEVVPVDESIAWSAGRLRFSYYHHERCPVSLADCVALATAQVLEDVIVTADPALLAIAVDEGIAAVTLPDPRAMQS